MKIPADFQVKNEINSNGENGQFGQFGHGAETPLTNTLVNLPKVLTDLLNIQTSEKDKQLTLFGGLVLIGAVLPNISTKYSKSKLYPNLYFYAVGKAGAGKGALTSLRKLIDPFKKEQLKFDSAFKIKEQLPESRKPILDSAEPIRNWLIPANNSSAGFLKMMNENGGEGILFETEGDTITNMLRTDYGNYSDMLRKAFHHEPITQYRKGDDELIELLNPRLSVCLSSTPGQLFKFIPDTENGLWSRFIFFVVESDTEFRDMFSDDTDSEPEYVIEQLSQILYAYRKTLRSNNPIDFQLTQSQKQKFNEFFSMQKSTVVNFINPDLDASIHRLACIFLRIAIILETLCLLEQGIVIPSVVYCSEDTFNNSIKLVEHLLYSLQIVYEMMPKKELNKLPENKLKFFTALPDGEFMVKNILKLGKSFDLSEKGIRRFLTDKSLFKRINHGIYQKSVV